MLSKIATLFTLYVVCAVAEEPVVHFNVDTSSLDAISQRWNQAGQNLVSLTSEASQNISSNITDVIDEYQERFENLSDKIRELNRRARLLLEAMAEELIETAVEIELDDVIDNLFDDNLVSVYEEYMYGYEEYFCNSTACYQCQQQWSREGLNYVDCSIQESYSLQNDTGYYYCYDYGTECDQQEYYSFCNDTNCYQCDNYTECSVQTSSYCDNDGCYNCDSAYDDNCTLQEDYSYCDDDYNCYSCNDYTNCTLTSTSYWNETANTCYQSVESYGEWTESQAYSCNKYNATGNYYCYVWTSYDYYSYDSYTTETECYEQWVYEPSLGDKLEDAFEDLVFRDWNITYGPYSFTWTNPEDFLDQLEDNFEDTAQVLRATWDNATAWFLFNTTDALTQLADDLENNTLPLMAEQIVQTEQAMLNLYSNSIYVNGWALSAICPVFPYWNEADAYDNTFDALSDAFVEPLNDLADATQYAGLEKIEDGYYYNQVVNDQPSDDGMAAWTYGIAAISGAAALAALATVSLRKMRMDSDSYERML